jgi:hypothetical protein
VARVMLFLVKISLVKKKFATVRCSDSTASPFDSKVRGEIFAHFYAVALKHHSSERN